MFFFASHFYMNRFDDIYVGILAFKSDIEPLHSDEFFFHKADYSNVNSYRYLVASHGYNDYDEMITIWHQQKSAGYA